MLPRWKPCFQSFIGLWSVAEDKRRVYSLLYVFQFPRLGSEISSSGNTKYPGHNLFQIQGDLLVLIQAQPWNLGSVKQCRAPGDSLPTRRRHRQTRTQLTARATYGSRIAPGMPTCSEWGTQKTKNMMLCSVTTRISFVVGTLRRIHGAVPSEAG